MVVVAVPLGEGEDAEEQAQELATAARAARLPNRRLGLVSWAESDDGVKKALKAALAAVRAA